MTQRSPFNDRYKVEQKGKTRRSASAAKPKRAVSELGTQPKKKSGRSSAWGRAKAASAAKQKSSTTAPELVPTDRFKRLSRYMWIGWVASFVGIIGVFGLQALGQAGSPFIPIGWIVYFIGIGIAFYMQFGPIRQERAVMVEAARSGHKGGKAQKAEKADTSEKSGKSAKAGEAPLIEARREDEESGEGDA